MNKEKEGKRREKVGKSKEGKRERATEICASTNDASSSYRRFVLCSYLPHYLEAVSQR